MKTYSLLSLCALLVLASCGNGKSAEGDVEKKPAVRIAPATEESVPQLSEYTATVEPDLINNISSAQPNRIKEIFVDEGMRVSKGQKLVVLDDVNTTTYELQLSNAKANLTNVERDYNRALELFKIGGGTRQQVDQMEAQLVNARTSVASAERTLRNARENTVLTSPISGVVTARNYDPGDMTGQLPILTVARVQPVKVVVNVTEGDLSRVHMGMPADVRFDTYGDEVFKGKISLISPTIDQATRTFAVEITLPNSDNKILPGMFGRVTLDMGAVDRVTVPDQAVVKQTGSGNHYVYTYADGKVSYDKVELGRHIGNRYEIISGVNPGAECVVSGQMRLSSGAEVEVLK